MKVRKHIYFSGQVQGVGFRYRSTYLARPLGLTGWVKNLWDGRVEMEIQGEGSAITKFLAELKNQQFIVIEGMAIEDIPLEERETSFSARDGWFDA